MSEEILPLSTRNLEASSQVNDEKEKMQSTSYQLFLLLLDQREVEVSNLNEVVLFI